MQASSDTSQVILAAASHPSTIPCQPSSTDPLLRTPTMVSTEGVRLAGLPDGYPTARYLTRPLPDGLHHGSLNASLLPWTASHPSCCRQSLTMVSTRGATLERNMFSRLPRRASTCPCRTQGPARSLESGPARGTSGRTLVTIGYTAGYWSTVTRLASRPLPTGYCCSS